MRLSSILAPLVALISLAAIACGDPPTMPPDPVPDPPGTEAPVGERADDEGD